MNFETGFFFHSGAKFLIRRQVLDRALTAELCSCGLNSSLENSLKLRDEFEKFVRILVVTVLISFLNLWIFHQSLKVNHHFREISLPPIHVRTQSTLKWKFLFVNSSAWHLIFRCLSLQGPASPLFLHSSPIYTTPNGGGGKSISHYTID